MDRSLHWSLLALVIVAVALAFVIPNPKRATDDGRVTITFCGGALGRDRLMWDDLRAEFERLHPDIRIRFIRATSTLERKVDTMIAGGAAPDVLAVGLDQIAHYVGAGAVLDLTDRIAADPELAADLEPGPDADFYEILSRPFRDDDGRHHLLPVWYTPFFVYYNRDLFDTWGVPYPDEDWDWDDMRSRARALTHDTDGDGRIDEFGLFFAQWQHGIETFILQNNGRILSDDGSRVAMDSPRTIEAIQYLYDLKFVDRVCPSSFLSPGVSPTGLFLQGKVGMYGPWGVFSIVDFREQITGFDWDVAPLPRGPDGTRAGLVAPYGFGVSTQSKHPDEAFEFVRFLASPRGQEIIARWALFIPVRKSVARSAAFLDPETKPESDWVLLHDVENGYAQLPAHTSARYGDVYRVINEELGRLLELNLGSPAETAARMTEKGNLALDRMEPVVAADGGDGNDNRHPPWALWIPGIVAIAVVAIAVARSRRHRAGILTRREERWGWIMISPWLVGFLVLAAGPILFSLGLSFCRWQSLSSLSAARFVGIENYRIALTGQDDKFYRSLVATLRYAGLAVPAGLVAGLTLALLMNTRIRGIRWYRTMAFMPAVLPSVGVTVLWWYLFNADSGWINHILRILQLPAPNWLGSPRAAPFVFVLMSLWAVGGSMIIYLAGLQGIPTSLYEAADIDGANRWQRFRHVTLPMLSPVIFFNLVMGIIGSFQVFNQAFVMYSGGGGPDDSTLFYVLHLFNEAIMQYRFGYGAALAWILFAIVLAFTLLVFKSSPLWVHYEGERRAR